MQQWVGGDGGPSSAGSEAVGVWFTLLIEEEESGLKHCGSQAVKCKALF